MHGIWPCDNVRALREASRAVKTVLHLVPYDGIGGVEEAARTMVDVRTFDIHFRVRYLFPGVRTHVERSGTNSPLQILRVASEVAREKPDLVVLSLWRSVLAGMLAKVMSPSLKLVLFIHNSQDAHILDRITTRLGLALAHAVWTDSKAALENRFARPVRKSVTVISYLVHKVDPLPRAGVPVAPVFIFWGRLSWQKNLPRAISLIAALQKHRGDVRFIVIGPDGDDIAAIRSVVDGSRLAGAVRFLGPKRFSEIVDIVGGSSAAFYLQTSRYEGMAMSVTEAMQVGLVPVVTPAGEIANYCRDAENAILLDSDANPRADRAAVDRLLRLLDQPEEYDRMREAALMTWSGKPLYSSSVIDASSDLLRP